MFEEIELYVYDKYIKGMIVEENGEKKISKAEIDELSLTPQEKNFIMYIIDKRKIKTVEEKITKSDRSPYVRDNNYGDIKTNELEKIDEPVMSSITYSKSNEKTFEDYSELDEYLETRFIPTYVLLKQRKNESGEIEHFLSIRLHHIMALKLSEVELEHVMNYLKEKNIRVGGKGATLDGEFENYDYVTTYKESALPDSVASEVTLKKITMYKQNNDQKLREEIIVDNMRLVPYVAYRYAIATGIDQHELESYGYEGLILALENFDLNFECKFSTYAVAYIRGKILNGIPNILLDKRDNFYYNYVNAKNAVEKENGLTLSEDSTLIEDIIELLVATGKVSNNEKSKEFARKKIMALELGNISLDDEEEIAELLSDGQLVDSLDYAEKAMNSIAREDIENVISTLYPQEEKVLRLRFGLDDGEPKTLEEIGKILNYSRSRIGQIAAKAIRKMRHPSRSKIIKDYYENLDEEKFTK